ncbi:MAG: hypothetical protein AB7S41_14260 [Parvibaculaceae bacterium]
MPNTAPPNPPKTTEFKAAQKAAADMRREIGEQQDRVGELRGGGKDAAKAERDLAGMQAAFSEIKTHREKMRADGASYKTRQPKRTD